MALLLATADSTCPLNCPARRFLESSPPGNVLTIFLPSGFTRHKKILTYILLEKLEIWGRNWHPWDLKFFPQEQTCPALTNSAMKKLEWGFFSFTKESENP